MRILADLNMYGRFAWGLRAYLRRTISLAEARTIVEQRLAERETNFLRLVERGIYDYPRSPYLPLLRMAGCEMGDVRNMVRARGLERTLHALRDAGVYFTFEEFKGRQSVERNGKTIPVQSRFFDNPYPGPCYQAESGGTTGPGTRVHVDLDHLAAQAPHLMLTRDAHSILDVPTAIWFGVFPDHSGPAVILRQAGFGRVAEKWFSPLSPRCFRLGPKNFLATHALVIMGRLFGAPIPGPERVGLDEAMVVTRWIGRTLEKAAHCLVRASVSKSLRVCTTAEELGLDLSRVTFMGGSEPPTPAKVSAITRSGARWVPTYFFAEAGAIGLGCAKPADGNDLHFLKDSHALIQYPRQVPRAETTVEAFYFTSLLPTAPKLMLNVESDDYGVVEHRNCGCPMEGYGLTDHIRHVRSFQKLTGEGVTLVGSDMVHILEEVLPTRFGGTPLDYQLVEEEDEAGLTRLCLSISPKIDIPDPKAVIEVVLDALQRGSGAAHLTSAIWSQAKTIQLRRAEPIWTARGKLMPIHMMPREG